MRNPHDELRRVRKWVLPFYGPERILPMVRRLERALDECDAAAIMQHTEALTKNAVVMREDVEAWLEWSRSEERPKHAAGPKARPMPESS